MVTLYVILKPPPHSTIASQVDYKVLSLFLLEESRLASEERQGATCIRNVPAIIGNQWKKYQVWPFLVVVQLIHRLRQADICCTTTAQLFFIPLLVHRRAINS